MNDFKRKNPAAHMTLMSSFEARKCQASLYSSQPATVLLPFSFIKAYQQRQGHTVECAIHLLNNKEISWSSQGDHLSQDLSINE